MRRPIVLLLLNTAFALAVPAANADLTLSVSAESADLAHLQVGQTVRFDVVLSGLPSGGQLDYLAGTVTFDSSLLGSALNVSAGAIIPDPTGFQGTGFPGAADAFYDAVFFSVTNTPISSNGVFYTFDVVAQQPGSGTLAFDLTSLAATDGNNNPVPLGAGPALPFTIGAPASVPELNSLVLVVAALACGGGAGVSRRLMRRVRARP
jgi:hypothetical protein